MTITDEQVREARSLRRQLTERVLQHSSKMFSCRAHVGLPF
jgi:hypothetical protein